MTTVILIHPSSTSRSLDVAARTFLPASLRLSNTKPSLPDLPDDVLLEILYQLDPRSIILFRGVCRRCAIISRIFSVWFNALRTLQNSVSWPRSRLERPAKLYLASELESIVIKMVRLQQNFTGESPTPVRTASLLVTPHNAGVLISGGRWFLTGSSDDSGRIWYSDLGAEVMIPRVLVQGSACAVQHMVVSVDGDADRLKFTMAVFFCSKEHSRDAKKAKTNSIWAVTIKNDGNELAATLLRSFDVFGYDDRGTSCLYGNRWIRGRADTAIFEVFDWTLSTSKTHRKAAISPEMVYTSPLTGLRLLPKNRILTTSISWIAIFDHPEPTDLPLGIRREDLPFTHPIWRRSLTQNIGYTVPCSPQFPYKRSGPIEFPFLVHESHTIHTFSIRSTVSLEVMVSSYPVGPRTLHRHAYLGWRWGVSRTPRRPPKLGLMQLPAYGHCPHSESPAAILREKDFEVEVDIGPGLWWFDEESGRLIVPSEDKLCYYVVYFI